MNKKIREIDIRAFRAYKDIQKFNFTHKDSGNIADFIAIYAPNGYGKTSFFDAIEWAVTGKIERLNSGKPIIEEVKREEDYILKNKDASEECGNVTIISEENEIFSIDTRKKTKRMKGDFKQGNIVKVSPELQTLQDEIDTFCTTNLLAHDKITGFLQNYTAGNKTNELSVMWDENNYSKILKEITELYDNLLGKKDQLLSEIKKEEKELKKYKYENEQNGIVVNRIIGYEMKYNKHFMNGNSFEIDKMQSIFSQSYEKSQKEQAEKKQEYNDSELLLNDYKTFLDNQRKLSLLLKNKNEYNKTLKEWCAIEQSLTKQKNIEQELKQILELLNEIELFDNYVNRMGSNNNKLRKIEDEKTKYQAKKIDIEKINSELLCKMKNTNLNIEELQIKSKQLEIDCFDYNRNDTRRKKYQGLNKKAKYILEQRKQKMQQLSAYIDQIDMLLNEKIEIESLQNIFSKDIVFKYNSIKLLKTEIKVLDENSNILEDTRQNMLELFDETQQLSIKGRDIIIKQKQNECPLCHVKYQNYEELLNKISMDMGKDPELKKVEEQIEKNNTQKLKVVNRLNLLVEEIMSQIVCIKDRYKNSYIRENQKIKKLYIKIEKWEDLIRAAKDICNKLENKYQQNEPPVSLNIIFKNKETEIKQREEEKINYVEKLRRDIEEGENKRNELEQNIQSCDLKILQIKKENSDISSSQLYIEVWRILAFMNLRTIV